MSILNVNQIQPVGSGQTITISASDITASSATITASSVTATTVTSSSTSTFSSGLNVTGGSVGIGTDNPGDLLTLYGTDPSIKLQDSSGDAFSLIEGDNTDEGSLRFRADPLSAGANTHIRFDTDGSERLRITSSGPIGINTTTVVESAQVQIRGASDGVLNLDTTDGRGSMIRFKENGTTKAWVGCAEGLITGTDQDDLGLRAVDNIVFRAGSSEAARFNSSGNLVFPSGQGIDFSATSDANGTMSSELLDDYEEGSWTPSLGGTSTNPTVNHTAQTGFYTKIGNLVYVSCLISSNTASGGSGALTVDGLPFVISQSTGAGGSPSFTGYDAPTSSSQAAINCASETWNGNTRMFAFLFSYDNSTWVNGNVSGLPAASNFSYRVCFGYQST